MGVRLKIGSVFSGIGLLDLGIETALNAETVWQCEIEPFCRRVLAKHWPHATQYTDITTIDPAALEHVDIMCGGFPCQDVSVAGRGEGLNGKKSSLFFEYMRIVRGIRPRVVVMENVPALRSRGLDRVLKELASSGYNAQWDGVPASALGAPHQRDRIFIIATDAERIQLRQQSGWSGWPDGEGSRILRDNGPKWEAIADAHLRSSDLPSTPRGPSGWGIPPPPVRRVDDGGAPRMDGPRRGRRPKADAARLKALGNAVVAPVAELIGYQVKRILEEQDNK